MLRRLRSSDGAAERALGGVLKRLLSSVRDAEPELPPVLAELLAAAPLLLVRKFPGQGRGLAAATDVPSGAELLRERPLVAAPAAANRRRVCYHCLAVLPPGGAGAIHKRAAAFCGPACLAEARSQYYELEGACVDLGAFDAACEAAGERFPLLAARLALTAAQHALHGEPPPPPPPGGGIGRISRISRGSVGSTGSARSARSAATLGSVSRGSLGAASWPASSSGSSSGGWARRRGAGALLTTSGGGKGAARPPQPGSLAAINAALGCLCFANVPLPPPAPWVHAHALLARALSAGGAMLEEPGAAARLAGALAELDVTWWTAVMARLHLNTFKVDAVWSFDFSTAGAAAMLGADAPSGSALYLLASLFNHSCEPNVRVSFPANDATAVFTAARDLAQGEQLFISYVDEGAAGRREFLRFAYGFAGERAGSRRLVLAIVLSQVLSVVVASTGVSSAALAERGASVPAVQACLSYALIAAVHGAIVAARALRRRGLPHAGAQTAPPPPPPGAWARRTWRRGWPVAVLAVIDAQANFLVVTAIRLTSLTSVQLLDCFTLPVVMVLSALALGARYGRAHCFGAGACVGGLALLVAGDAANAGAAAAPPRLARSLLAAGGGPGAGGAPLLGDALAVLGAVLYGVANVMQEALLEGACAQEPSALLAGLGAAGAAVAGAQAAALGEWGAAAAAWARGGGGVAWPLAGFAGAMLVIYSVVPQVLLLGGAAVLNLGLLTADAWAAGARAAWFGGFPGSSAAFFAASLLLAGGGIASFAAGGSVKRGDGDRGGACARGAAPATERGGAAGYSRLQADSSAGDDEVQLHVQGR
ncbi:Slc35f1 [Scenedesmus sp. PABB004]|nr:Slc35f1 [Scenedesmus sp. PABB004]